MHLIVAVIFTMMMSSRKIVAPIVAPATEREFRHSRPRGIRISRTKISSSTKKISSHRKSTLSNPACSRRTLEEEVRSALHDSIGRCLRLRINRSELFHSTQISATLMNTSKVKKESGCRTMTNTTLYIGGTGILVNRQCSIRTCTGDIKLLRVLVEESTMSPCQLKIQDMIK